MLSYLKEAGYNFNSSSKPKGCLKFLHSCYLTSTDNLINTNEAVNVALDSPVGVHSMGDQRFLRRPEYKTSLGFQSVFTPTLHCILQKGKESWGRFTKQLHVLIHE